MRVFPDVKGFLVIDEDRYTKRIIRENGNWIYYDLGGFNK